MYDEISKQIQDKKDSKSQIEIQLFDHKNGRVAYKRLTYDELLKITAVLGVIHWKNV